MNESNLWDVLVRPCATHIDVVLTLSCDYRLRSVRLVNAYILQGIPSLGNWLQPIGNLRQRKLVDISWSPPYLSNEYPDKIHATQPDNI
jgi:hypothetical protein